MKFTDTDIAARELLSQMLFEPSLQRLRLTAIIRQDLEGIQQYRFAVCGSLYATQHFVGPVLRQAAGGGENIFIEKQVLVLLPNSWTEPV